ncbi:hypothetical protein [Streptomyces sp. NPDC089919]|uniref:hypothetical protein n=1 Tax=Streptomyces sp. NPDC089919 TaxID=3155188 RepID=UPI003433DC32
MTTAESPAAGAARPAGAWALENAVLSAAMVAQRMPWLDAPARALGLDLLTREGVTRSLLDHLRRTRSGAPVRVGTPFGTFLVPLTAADAEELPAAAAAAGVLDPALGLSPGGHRCGLSPHAEWAGEPTRPAAQLDALAAEEAAAVLGARRGDGTLEWAGWRQGMLRLARRVVVGAAAAEDTLLSEVSAAEAAAVGGRGHAARRRALSRRLEPYLTGPEPGGKDGAARPGDPAAVAHALALVSEAVAGPALRAVALLAAGCAGGPEDAVAESLRRYPPVSAVLHPVRAAFVWRGTALEPGTEILCAPGWLPEAAAGGRTERIPLCGAPGPCAAAAFAVQVAEAVVRAVFAVSAPVLLAPQLRPGRLPESLDPRRLLVAVADPAGGAGDGRVARAPQPAVPVSAYGCSPAAYGALARASADRLERHAESLTVCAGNPGWDADGTGERFRTDLLGHAERCAEAAAAVRRSALRLAE